MAFRGYFFVLFHRKSPQRKIESIQRLAIQFETTFCNIFQNYGYFFVYSPKFRRFVKKETKILAKCEECVTISKNEKYAASFRRKLHFSFAH